MTTVNGHRVDSQKHYVENGKVFCLHHEEELHWAEYDKALAKAIGHKGGWGGCKYCAMPDEMPETQLPDGYNSEFLS